MDNLRLSTYYMRLLTAAGGAAFIYSALRLDTSVVDLQFLLLFAFTALVGSRMGVSIPKTQAEITVSDTFIFLTILLYGGEAAVLLAACEAFCTSLRFTKKWFTRFFNAGLLAFAPCLVLYRNFVQSREPHN